MTALVSRPLWLVVSRLVVSKRVVLRKLSIDLLQYFSSCPCDFLFSKTHFGINYINFNDVNLLFSHAMLANDVIISSQGTYYGVPMNDLQTG